MICAIFGKKYSIEFIEKHCAYSKNGMSVRALREGAKNIGLDSRAGRVDKENLQKIPLPAIMLLDGDHYVVLYGIDKRGKYLVADPMTGKRILSKFDLDNHWSEGMTGKGIVVIFEKTYQFGLIYENQKKRQIYSKLFKYFSPFPTHFLSFFIGVLIGGAIQILFPFLTQIVVDVGIPNKDINLIWLILAGELIVVFGRTAGDFIRRWLLVRIANKVSLEMNGDFILKFLSLPMDFFEKKTVGDTLQRMDDFSRIQSFISSRLLGSIYSMLLVVALMAVLYHYSVIVFVIIISCTASFIVWTAAFLKKRKDMDNLLFKANARLQDVTMQMVGTPQEIKIHGCHDYQISQWEVAKAKVLEIQVNNLRLVQKQDGGKVFIKEIRNLVVNVTAASLVISGNLSLGGMFAIMFIMGQISNPIEQVINFILDFQNFKISLERVSEVHETPSENSFYGNLIAKNINNCDIIFENVSFRYVNDGSPFVLKDVSLRIPAGKITAIVGPSGSGKTTLIKIILGYYKCTKGNIFIGNNNLVDLNIKEWRNNCGVVLQNGKIFNDTITKNISLCDDPKLVDRTRLFEAASIANILGFVEQKPAGFDTILGKDGAGLSQGQKQRILIARAVYRDSKILIFDEATNSLDSETEKVITHNLSTFYKGRTVIIIAHRLSTVVDADKIVVMENGMIAEEGSHNELIKQQDKYYNLIRNQLDFA